VLLAIVEGAAYRYEADLLRLWSTYTGRSRTRINPAPRLNRG